MQSNEHFQDYLAGLPWDFQEKWEHVITMAQGWWEASEEKKTIYHTLYGRRVNDCLSRAVAYVLSKKHHKDVEIGINDNGFSIQGVTKQQASNAFKLLNSEKLELLMKVAIDNSEVYKRRFRHCATRALMILRNYMGRQKRVGRQQVSSMILMAALRRISNDFTILQEARREVLEDLMDIENTRTVLSWIESGKTTSGLSG